MVLALLIQLKSNRGELFDDVLRAFVLLDVAIRVEKHHIRGGDGGAQMEKLFKALLLGLRQLVGRHGQHEMHRVFGMVLAELSNERTLLLPGLRQELQQPLLVILCPFLDGELGDLHSYVTAALRHADGLEATWLRRNRRDRAVEATEPRRQGFGRLLADDAPDRCNDVSGVVHGHRRAPTGADAFSPIDQDQRHDRTIPTWLDAQIFLVKVFEHWVVLLGENRAERSGRLGVYVPRRGVVLAALQPGAELP
mmetsp:Transcript_20133/g.60266  ORF Transcript_20133/g.60266 Transcript_20133/m.60266 type:complete len:252 (-) Transcript_20133:457-1212(-)